MRMRRVVGICERVATYIKSLRAAIRQDEAMASYGPETPELKPIRVLIDVADDFHFMPLKTIT